MAKQYDLIIIGAGIIGLATGYRYLQQHPGASLLILEKELTPAQHQTGRNSGVVHAGVYYAPDSAKAKFCRQGRAAITQFCMDNQLPYEQRGKLLVATNMDELQRMAMLEARAKQNGLTPELVSAAKLSELEPGLKGQGGLLIKESAITSYGLIAACLAEKIRQMGAEIRYGMAVDHLEEGATVSACVGSECYQSSKLIACAGIHTDKLIRALGATPQQHMVPFRGEYYRIGRAAGLALKHMIYPIPDPQLPFLGVHLTPMFDGSITAGPNAILAFGKESYRWQASDLISGVASLLTPGVLPLLFKQRRSVLQELGTSLLKGLYLEQVQKYLPQLRREHLQAYPAGIRAQAVSPQGELLDDFLFTQTEHCLIVANAPSPAATSCFPIAQHILTQLQRT